MVAGGVALLLAIGAAAALLISTATRLSHEENLDRDHLQPAIAAQVRLLVDFLDQETAVRGYLLAAQPAFLGPYTQAQQRIPATEGRLRAEVAGVPAAAAALSSVSSDYRRWHDGYAAPQLALVAGGGLAAAQQREESGAGRQLFNQIRISSDTLASALSAAVTAERHKVRQLQDELVVLLSVALGALGVLVVAATTLVVRSVTLPVAELARSTRDAAAGELRGRRRRRGSGELRQLGDDADALRARLLDETDRARHATEAIAQQSPTVAALLDALTPRVDTVAGLDVAGRLDPAEGLLAGDWYDMLDVGRGRLALVLGDVSGHGPASAVLALELRQVVAALLLGGAAPAAALAAASRVNEQGSAELFATVLVAVLDPRAGRIEYANAGHPPALVHGAGGRGEWARLPATGPLLSAVVSPATWTTGTQLLPPGAGLLAYTDGVLECRDEAGREFGQDRLLASLAGAASQAPAEVVASLAERIDAFSGPVRRDDRTVLYCRRVEGVTAG